MKQHPTRGLAGLLWGTGHAMQRISLFMFLAVLVGLPLAVILPNRPGLVLLAALYLAALVRLVRHRR